MKNLFNDISRQEKNRILEMHGVKRNRINESQQEELEKHAADCFTKKTAPKLYDLCLSYGLSLWAALSVLATIYSGGISAGVTATSALLSFGEGFEKFKESVENNKSTYEGEAKSLLSCYENKISNIFK